MKYIYDIVLNFNEIFYEFYEWNEEDDIEYIKRIPIIKVSDNDLNIIKNNKIIMNTELVESFKNMCEIYTEKSIKKLDYACLFCSNTNIVAIMFNNKGYSILKSDLEIDEALDIIEYSKKMKSTTIDYKIISFEKRELYTREESIMINFMNKELNYMYENNLDKLKYIYYECFNKIEKNKNKMFKSIKKHINSTPEKLYNLLTLKGLQK